MTQIKIVQQTHEKVELQYAILPVTPLQQNCTFFWNAASKKAAIIDPGGDVPRIMNAIESLKIEPIKIFITHAHADHAGGTYDLCAALKAKYQTNIPIIGPHRKDQYWIDRIENDGQLFGIGISKKFMPDQWLEDGDEVDLDGLKFQIIHCPGHTPGHVVFYHEASKLAQVGDVLFKGSIGRSDFPHGDHDDLIYSIRHKLFPLCAKAGNIDFICGHGAMSDFLSERNSNPFVADHLFANN